MNSLVIVMIIFVLGIVMIPSFAQSNNCPQGTKAEVQGVDIVCVPIGNIERTCPVGTYHGVDSQGNPTCRDIKTNQIVDPKTGTMYDSHTGEIIFQDDQNGYIIIGVIIFIIIIAIIVKASQGKTIPESGEYKDIQRKGFSYQTKEMVKEKQNAKCKRCGRIPTHWEFDHINGRGDNSIDNCQGLCRDCHQDKTLNDNW